MKLIIAGSRYIFPSKDELFEIIDNLGILYKITEIVSGNCAGVDRSGEEFARQYNIKLKTFPADWNKYGKFAGPFRNKEMAKYADMLLLIHSNTKGSLNMKKCMLALNKPICEVLK